MADKRIKKKNRCDLFDVINITLITLLLVIMIYPMYYTVIASFSSANAVATGKVKLWPQDLSFNAYEQVFAFKQIWVGYGNTILYTVLGTCWNLFLTIPAGYALSKKYLPHRNFYMTLFLITMYFSGGMIPTYLQVKNRQPWSR